MFPKERAWPWSNKAAEWLSQRFLPCRGQTGWKALSSWSWEGREGSSTLPVSIWTCSASSPACPYLSPCHRLWTGGTSLGPSLVFRGEMLWSRFISEVSSKTWKVNSRRTEIIVLTGSSCNGAAALLCTHSSCSHWAVCKYRMVNKLSSSSPEWWLQQGGK